MKHFTVKGKHYIWRPQVMAANLAKAAVAIGAGIVWAAMLLTVFTGGPLW